MAKPSRIAAALQYLQQMRDRAADFGGGVADTLADRARDVGGLAYEALTSDPNIGRMTTAEFSQAADRPTPRLDAMGRGAVELGRAVLTQPVETGKAVVRGEIERARGAMENPRAMGQYAGEFVNPLRLAAALRRGPMAQMGDVVDTSTKVKPENEDIAQALELPPTEMPSSPLMSFTERKTAVGRTALKNLHKERGVEYKDWSFERGGAHTPAGPNSGSPAFDVTMNDTYPDDFYGVNGLRYYGTGYDALDSDAYSTLSRLAGRPNATVTVYRAVEKDAEGKINPGDWVTTSRAYAKEHGQNALNNNFKIVKSTVKASDIWTSGDSMLEWGYHPQESLPEIRWR